MDQYQEYRMIYKLSDGSVGVVHSKTIDKLEIYEDTLDMISYSVDGFDHFSWVTIKSLKVE